MESLRQHQNQTDSTTKLCASFTHRTKPWPSSTTRTATKVSGSVSTLSNNVRHSPGLPNLHQHWSLSLWRWATECCGYLNYKVMLLHKICALHIAVGFHLSLSSNTHAVDLWWTILQTRIRSIQTFYLVVLLKTVVIQCSFSLTKIISEHLMVNIVGFLLNSSRMLTCYVLLFMLLGQLWKAIWCEPSILQIASGTQTKREGEQQTARNKKQKPHLVLHLNSLSNLSRFFLLPKNTIFNHSLWPWAFVESAAPSPWLWLRPAEDYLDRPDSFVTVLTELLLRVCSIRRMSSWWR